TSNSNSNDSYEEVLRSTMQELKRSNGKSTGSLPVLNNLKSTGSIGSIGLSDSLKGMTPGPTESRIEFVKHILDGNKLQPMIDFDSSETDSDYIRLRKKTMNVKELFISMNVGLEYIKSGTTGHTFKATSKTDASVAFAVKVCAYPKLDEYGGIKNPMRPENAELRMLKLLSKFVIKMKTPHFILPIGTFNTSIKPFINVPTKLIDLRDEKHASYRKFIEKCEKDEFEDLVSILISEWANGGDLLDYIRRNYKKISLEQWTVIFFQILFTLASIHKEYPAFKHNDMKGNNILIRLIKNEKPGQLYGYSMADDPVKFKIPAIGLQIKIWDFDFACIDGLIENNKVNSTWTKKMNISKSKNQYYDMHYFFNTLICEKFFPQFYTGGAPKEIVEFVQRIIPEKYRSVISSKYTKKGGRILVDHEYTTPYKVIMEDPLFKKYKFNC
ncbi:MAG TPA: hypothetical protein VKR58_15235, partial [Aquella sp.]|nr:hypothetical protein [Aquella sp.]